MSYQIKQKEKELAYIRWKIKQNDKLIKAYEKAHNIKKRK